MNDRKKHTLPVPRDEQGHLQRGARLNPAGRPAGTSLIERFRALVAPDWPEMVRKIIDLAKSGDARMAEILATRMVPPARPQAERIVVAGLREQTTIRGKADAILGSVASGEISAEAGRQALAMLADFAKVISIDDHEARFRRLEGKRPPQTTPTEPIIDGELVEPQQEIV